MNKKTILFPAFLFLAFSTMAQKYRIGLFAGPSYSYLVSSERFYGENQPDLAANMNRKSGLTAGVDVRYPLFGRWSALSGIQYTEKGNRFAAKIGGQNETAINYLHYLSIPFLADYKLWDFCSLQTGADCSWLMRRNIRPVNPDLDPAQFTGNRFSTFDLGFIVGLEFRFGKSFFFRARHIVGATPVRRAPLPDHIGSGGESINQYNRNSQLMMGYRF